MRHKYRGNDGVIRTWDWYNIRPTFALVGFDPVHTFHYVICRWVAGIIGIKVYSHYLVNNIVTVITSLLVNI